MNFKNENENIAELVNTKLDEIQHKANVKILHAVESGSRAWGFASPDSDYDVRFIYARAKEDYLKLEEKKDFIDWELNEIYDINGWDLKKALQHFHKSNATLFEWSNSPQVYRTTREWEEIKEVSQQYFSCKASMYHYYGTAYHNYNEYLLEKDVQYKKYFYVLRPILACKWIDEKKCPPPVLFSELADAVLETSRKPLIENLLKTKLNTAESQKGERIDDLNSYLFENLQNYKEIIRNMQDDRNADWEPCNQLFLKIIS